MEDQSTDHDTQSYMCFPLSQIDKTRLEAGNNIIMPASALSSSSQKLICRMIFRIAKSNDTSTLHYHCGVAEFTADDGFVFLPTWIMKKLNIREGDLVDVKSTSLPEGNYIKPSHVISLFEDDNYEVEFAKPLDHYKEARRKRFLGQGSAEILEEDDTIYQPMKKKLRYQLSSEANKQQTIIRKILLVAPNFHAIVDKQPCGDNVVKLDYPLEWKKNGNGYLIRVIGTFNGIVVLVVNHYKHDEGMPKKADGKPNKLTSRIILYNPLTRASEILPDPYSPFYEKLTHTYGIGYGATKDDLKIVRFRGLTIPDKSWDTCDVFNLKERSWSTSEILIKDACLSDVGTFLDGSSYWFAHNKIVALNVNEMVISEIHLPCTHKYPHTRAHLGTLNGRLCMITNTDEPFRFNLWVMKTEQGVKNSWSESRSLTLHLEDKYRHRIQFIKLLDDGSILMIGGTKNELIIYDISKDTYKVQSGTVINRDFFTVKAIEYEESLLPPSIL